MLFRVSSSLVPGLMAAWVMALASGCGPTPEGPARIASTEVAAIDTPPPEYPLALACDGVGGRVDMMVSVGTDGRVTVVDIQRSSGHAELDQAARKAMPTWKFQPATANGQAIVKKMLVPVTFSPPPIPPDRCNVLQEQQRRGQL